MSATLEALTVARRKTNRTDDSVDAFIDSIKDESKREDCRAITKLMATATGQKATSLIKKLGKHKYSGGCLHVARLADVDTTVLARMIEGAYRTG
jgi:hypothetical protein